MSGGTISNTITTTVTLDSAGYASPLTIAATGAVNPSTSLAVGIYVPGAVAGAITNYGTITGGPDAGAAIDAVGTMQLNNFGVILAGANAAGGVQLSGAGEVYNAGTIAGVSIGGSASLVNNGQIVGMASDRGTGALINTGSIYGGVSINSGATGANSGSISGSGVGAAFRYPAGYYQGTNPPARMYSAAIYGSFTNYGLIAGTARAGGTGGGVIAGGALLNRGTVVGGVGALGARLSGEQSINYGTITGGTGSSTGGNGVDENGDGAVITNFGTMIGGDSTFAAGVGVDAMNYVYGPAGPALLDTLTFVNAGLVEGGVGYKGARGDALTAGGVGTFTLIVDPGASFIGNVEAFGIMQLAGSSSVALTGIGSSIAGFSTISFATGASWAIEGDIAGLAKGQTISGFTLGDTITLDGFTAASTSYVPPIDGDPGTGGGLELSNGTITETLGIIGKFNTSSFIVIDRPDATEILINPNPSGFISTTVTTSVTLGGGAYTSPLTITTTGAIAPTAPGAGALYAAIGTATNQGSIIGGAGAALAGTPQPGGDGVMLTGATLFNAGAITGGASGGNNPGGGTGGAGVSQTAGSLDNGGTITGGAGAFSGGAGGTGGVGLLLSGGTASSGGLITGGLGGGAMYGEEGVSSGAGLYQTAGQFTNAGTLTGGASNNALKPGHAGFGADLIGGSLLNQGLIIGGGGYYAANGADIFGGALTNAGTILGGPGTTGRAGTGVYLSGGTLTNTGLISGGHATGTYAHYAGSGVLLISQSAAAAGINSGTIIGGYSNGDGGTAVVMDASRFTNSGTLAGGYGQRVGGEGALIDTGSFTNTGTITGGASHTFAGDGVVEQGGTLSNLAGGVIAGGVASGLGGGADISGAGVDLVSGYVTNGGSIAGAAGYATNTTGGAGVSVFDGTLINTGIITGGAGRGDGVDLGNQVGHGFGDGVTTLINSGLVVGGAANPPGTGTLVQPGGIGVQLYGLATLSNTGTIIGGSGGSTGSGGDGMLLSGISLKGSTATNHGVIVGGAGTVGGTGAYIGGGTFINAGTVQAGQGAAPGDAIRFGDQTAVLVVDPGAVFIGAVAANAARADELELASASTAGSLNMGNSFTGFTTIGFEAGARWSLSGDTNELAGSEKIIGFAAGDTLNLEGFTATSDTFAPGTGLELSNGSFTETIDLIGNFSTGSFIVLDRAGGTEIQLCYLRGTQILTPAGEVPIETLNIGDTVITRFNGYRRIKWIGRQSFGRRFIETNRAQRPIRIAAGALGPHLPKRDLYVSPGHSMLIGNVLVLASSLLNGVTITQDQCPEEVHYYQVEFETHDCVQAEGCWSESFCDYADLRNQFHNVADFRSLFPNHVIPADHLMCAPRPEHGTVLEAALRPIAARAAACVEPGPLRGWIDHVGASGVITGWAQDTAHPELPVLLEILLHNRALGAILACDPRADLAAAGIGHGRAAFAFKAPGKIPRAAWPSLQIRRAGDRAVLPMAPHCPGAVRPASQSRRKRA